MRGEGDAGRVEREGVEGRGQSSQQQPESQFVERALLLLPFPSRSSPARSHRRLGGEVLRKPHSPRFRFFYSSRSRSVRLQGIEMVVGLVGAPLEAGRAAEGESPFLSSRSLAEKTGLESGLCTRSSVEMYNRQRPNTKIGKGTKGDESVVSGKSEQEGEKDEVGLPSVCEGACRKEGN